MRFVPLLMMKKPVSIVKSDNTFPILRSFNRLVDCEALFFTEIGLSWPISSSSSFIFFGEATFTSMAVIAAKYDTQK